MRIILSFLFLISSWSGFSQIPYLSEVKLRPELRDIEVKSLYQDDRSIIWIGTQIGLIRHNGIKERLYKTEQDSAYSVTAIFRDAQGTLWIGCENGMIASLENDFANDNLKKVRYLNSEVTKICDDNEGNVWAATYGQGIVNLNSQDKIDRYDTGVGLPSNEIYDISFTSKGDLIIGSDRGLSILTRNKKSVQVRNFGIDDGLSDDVVTDIFLNEDDQVYAGTNEGGVFVFDVKKQKVIHKISSISSQVNKIYARGRKEIYIAADDGLYYFDSNRLQLTKMQGISHLKGKTDHLIVDDESNIWFTSVGGKLIKGNLLFRSLSMSTENLHSVLIVEEDLWVGNENDLAVMRNFFDGERKLEVLNAEINVSVLKLVSSEYVLVGTLNQGVFIYETNGRFLKSIKEINGLPKGSILDIAVKGDRIVVSSLGGVVEFNFSDLIDSDSYKATEIASLKNRFIYCVHIDNYDETWFGTDAKGIIKIDATGKAVEYDKVKMTNSTDSSFQKLGSVYSICSDWYGRVWFSTSEEGLLRFDGKKFYKFPILPFVKNYPYTSVMTDKSNQLILARQGGVDILEPGRDHIMYLDRELGIDDQDEQYLNSFTYDLEGNLWFIHSNRLYQYCPTESSMKIHPSITFDNILVDFKPIDELSEAEFSYDKNNVVFNYDGLWYTDPSKLTFRYMLEGYDKSWITSKDQQATYSELSPGNYRFRVMACENETFSDEPEAVYTFEILKPIWARWWFIVICGIAVFFIIRWYIKFREVSAKKESDLEKEKIAGQLQSLKNQINPHFLFNSFNTLLSLIEEDPQEAAVFTEKLSDFYRAMLKNKDQDLISLDEELDCVKTYFSLIKGRFGENIDLYIEPFSNNMLIAPFTIQLLMENAIKHNIISKDKPLYVTIKRSGDYIEVRNNMQPKLTKAKDSGYGLRNIDARYELLAGQNIIVDNDSECFTVKIPIVSNN